MNLYFCLDEKGGETMFVLDQLWREGISPSERYTRKGSEYHKILLRICDEGDKLNEELTEKGKKHFEAYQQAQVDLSVVSERLLVWKYLPWRGEIPLQEGIQRSVEARGEHGGQAEGTAVP